MKKINCAQIGLGRWGPNLFRNFVDNPNVIMKQVCDCEKSKAEKIAKYGIPFCCNSDEILQSGNGIDAVIIATPLESHFELAKKALLQGKHIFIEKPLAATVEESLELAELAKSRKLCLMVGHVFLFNAGIRYIKELIDKGELGNILFIYGQRTNLGPIRQDTNAFWDLAAHDISIFNYWLDAQATDVSACGSRILSQQHEDVVSAVFNYPGNIFCQIIATWLHPQKIRQITVVGDRKMAVWDDMDQAYPVKIYDKSVSKNEAPEQIEGTLAEFNFLIQEGDVHIPKIPLFEPLKSECAHFIDCLLNGDTPLCDADNGVEIVAALAAADKSLRMDSARIKF